MLYSFICFLLQEASDKNLYTYKLMLKNYYYNSSNVTNSNPGMDENE